MRTRHLRDTIEDLAILVVFDQKIATYECTLDPDLIETEIFYNDYSYVLKNHSKETVIIAEDETSILGCIVLRVESFPRHCGHEQYGYIN